MKNSIVLFLVLIQTEAFCQSLDKPTLHIKYVNPGISTIIAVDYKKFDSAFAKGMYRDTVINNLYVLQKLKKEYTKLVYCKKYKRIDTRYKISLFYPDAVTPILVYMSYYGEAVINNRLLSKSNFLNTLKEVIDSLVSKK